MKNDVYYRSNEDLSFVATSHEEERELFKRAKSGDDAAKELIIRNHLLLVANIARRLCKGQLADDDIVSAANFALMKAYENFKPEFPNRFSSFLQLHVRGEIARLWHEKNLVSKADFNDGIPVVSVPLSEEIADENDSDEKEHHAFLVKLLNESRGVLDDREAKILGLIYVENGVNQAEAARRLKITRERVRQIHDTAIAKLGRELRKKMNEQGVNQ